MKHALVVIGVLALTSCQADRLDPSLNRMQDQPRLDAFEPGVRAAPEGAIPYRAGTDSVTRKAEATPELIERGADRFAIYCAPCHGSTGHGDGPVASYLVTAKPPALVDARGAPAFEAERVERAIEQGYRIMPSYAARLEPHDRRAVVAYVEEGM